MRNPVLYLSPTEWVPRLGQWLTQTFCRHSSHPPSHRLIEAPFRSSEHLDFMEVVECGRCEKILVVETVVKGDKSRLYELIGARL